MKKRIVLGITGCFGSGKSTALQVFSDFDVPTLQVDALVHNLYKPGKRGAEIIRAHFGAEFLLDSGEVDRPKLRKLVLSDVSMVTRLNESIHPVVKEEVKSWIDLQNSDFIVFESLYLFENLYTHSLCVQSSESNIVNRLLVDKRFTIEEIRRFLFLQRRQIPAIFQTSCAFDFCVQNDATKKALETEVKNIYTLLRYGTQQL